MFQPGDTVDRGTDRLEQLPLWAKLPILLLLWPCLLAYGMLGMAFLLLIVVPYVTVDGWRADRRQRRALERAGRVMRWSEALERLNRQEGAVLIDVVPKGLGLSWWLDGFTPGPEWPTYDQFDREGWKVFERIGNDRLQALGAQFGDRFAASAKLVTGAPPELDHISASARGRIIVGCMVSDREKIMAERD